MAEILNGFLAKNIKKAAKLLKKGEPVAFPTETVYGLGAIAYQKKAVAKIFEIKERPFFDPIIVHIANLQQLEEVAEVNDERVYLLVKHFWPGPLTLILPKKKKVPYLVTAGLETVGVRMPQNLVALSLIEEVKMPIAAPSANKFSQLSPTRAEHVEKQIGDKIKIILDGEKSLFGVESTILLMEETPVVLRTGALPIEEIEKVIGPVLLKKKISQVLAPGNLKTHYSPIKPLILISSEEEIDKLKDKNKKIGFLAFQKIKNKKQFVDWKILSEKGDLKEAASNFFDYLHQLDDGPAEIIFAEKVEEVGLGKAIMERLMKAMHK
ncbi:MAG: L-threonylcarbamoyladenylate synthase [Minisyncoccia bacterium]